MRDLQHDLAFDPLLGQKTLIHLLAPVAIAHLHVFQGAELFQAQLRPGDAVVAADQADEVVGEQALLVDVRRVEVGEVAEGAIDAAFAQAVEEVVGAQAHAVDAGVGRGAAQAVEDGGQEDHFADFAGAEGEGFAGARRVEAGVWEDFLVDGGDHFTGAFDNAARPWRGFHSGTVAHEQRFAVGVAQAETSDGRCAMLAKRACSRASASDVASPSNLPGGTKLCPHAERSVCGNQLWRRLQPRLGGQGTEPAGDQGGGGTRYRAHSPQQPDWHGRAAAALAEGASVRELALVGRERLTFLGLAQLTVGDNPITLRIERSDGSIATSLLALRLDSLQELGYLEHGGVLPFVIRKTVQRTRQGALDD